MRATITPYVLNVTNAFAGAARVPPPLVARRRRIRDRPRTLGQSINNNGCVVSNGTIAPTLDDTTTVEVRPLAVPGLPHAEARGDTASPQSTHPPSTMPAMRCVRPPRPHIPLDGWWIRRRVPTRPPTTGYSTPIRRRNEFWGRHQQQRHPACRRLWQHGQRRQDALIWTYGAATAADLNTYAAGLGAANLAGWVFRMPTASTTTARSLDTGP